MYLAKTPYFIQNLFPNFIWKIPIEEKKIFLTFDDGPIPQITPWVLDVLNHFNAKATFFCVGENVSKYPNIFHKIIKQGHSVGSHTNNHMSGWGSENVPYFHNVRRGATLVKSALFRPPYGRLKPSQVPFLMRHYYIIMWDVLSGDFDLKLSKEQCLENVLLNADSGSIVVFHDSIKAKEKLTYSLPQVITYFSEQGYTFEAISEDFLNSTVPLRKTA